MATTTKKESKNLNQTQIEETVMKALYTGVGFIASTAEKLQQSLEEFMNEDNEVQEEGKKVVDGLLNTAESRKVEFESKINDYMEKFTGKFDMSNKKSITDLEERIAALEVKLAKKATVTKKATTTK